MEVRHGDQVAMFKDVKCGRLFAMPAPDGIPLLAVRAKCDSGGHLIIIGRLRGPPVPPRFGKDDQVSKAPPVIMLPTYELEPSMRLADIGSESPGPGDLHATASGFFLHLVQPGDVRLPNFLKLAEGTLHQPPADSTIIKAWSIVKPIKDGEPETIYRYSRA
jgi:hypothetical protein